MLEKTLVFGDLHAPYHDKHAFALAKAVAKKWKPDRIISVGDWADCYIISDYPKTPRRFGNLKAELKVAEKCADEVKKLADEFTILRGNHEDRLERFLATRAPQLFGLVEMHELLGLAKERCREYREVFRVGKCHYVHDVGFCGKNAISQSLAEFGGNLVFGHTHAPGIIYTSNLRGENHAAMNVGWLGDPKMIDYTSRRKAQSWQPGVGLVEQDAKGNCWFTFVPFIKGAAIVNGGVVRA